MADPINTKEEYIKEFRFDGLKESDKNYYKKQSEALKNALDIRKFEIELYWKRATYFWTFIAAAFAGYFLLQRSESPHPEFSLLISCLGFIFSLGWYFVNRGSKHWQNNWERHVDLLEDEISGPLYKTIVKADNTEKGKLDFLIKPGEYSVSKINQIISVYVVALWLILIINSIDIKVLTTYLILFFTTTFAWWLYRYGRSGNSETVSLAEKRSSVIKEQKP